jgi:hypothetical protein
MKKYEELELQVKEIQKEIDRLKKEEKKQNTLPTGFDRNRAIKFLETFEVKFLDLSFIWTGTPQGWHYWQGIRGNLNIKTPGYKVPDKAIIQIQKWIILSYQQEM